MKNKTRRFSSKKDAVLKTQKLLKAASIKGEKKNKNNFCFSSFDFYFYDLQNVNLN